MMPPPRDRSVLNEFGGWVVAMKHKAEGKRGLMPGTTDAAIRAQIAPFEPTGDSDRIDAAVASIRECTSTDEQGYVVARLFLPPNTMDRLPPSPPPDWGDLWQQFQDACLWLSVHVVLKPVNVGPGG